MNLLSSKQVVGSPVRKLDSGDFVREVDLGNLRVGNLPADAGGASTSTLTVITDFKGNLVNTFPGPLRY